jgi:electron transfer flavoprotein beta subunit
VNEAIDPLVASRVFVEIARKESADLVIVGKQAIDDDAAQTAPMVAALWDRPQATFASKIELRGNTAVVTREVDAGLETIEVDLPAVFSADLRLNEPRYVKLPDIMKAKKKPLDVVDFASLGVAADVGLKAVFVEPPKPRAKGVIVKDVAELVDALKKKGLV